MNNKNLLLLIFILILSLLSGNVYAGIFSCKFTEFSDENGHYKVADNYKLIAIIKQRNKLATIIYKDEEIPVSVVLNNEGGLTLVEFRDLGMVLTTIDINGKIVQSRNTIAVGNIIPSQYYGTCEFFIDEIPK